MGKIIKLKNKTWKNNLLKSAIVKNEIVVQAKKIKSKFEVMLILCLWLQDDQGNKITFVEDKKFVLDTMSSSEAKLFENIAKMKEKMKSKAKIKQAEEILKKNNPSKFAAKEINKLKKVVG